MDKINQITENKPTKCHHVFEMLLFKHEEGNKSKSYMANISYVDGFHFVLIAWLCQEIFFQTSSIAEFKL